MTVTGSPPIFAVPEPVKAEPDTSKQPTNVWIEKTSLIVTEEALIHTGGTGREGREGESK